MQKAESHEQAKKLISKMTEAMDQDHAAIHAGIGPAIARVVLAKYVEDLLKKKPVQMDFLE